jgi:hypothetical protein
MIRPLAWTLVAWSLSAASTAALVLGLGAGVVR